MTNETPHNISGWRPQAPDNRDFTLAAHRPDILGAGIPSKAAVRPILSPVLDQGQEGSCTAFGSLGAHEAVARKMNIVYPLGSRQAQYYWSRVLEGWQNQDSGAIIRDAVKVLAQTGMANAALWGYAENIYVAPPASVAVDASQRQAVKYIAVSNDGYTIKQVVASGYPVIVGFSVPQNFPMQTTTGMVPMPSGQIIGGHCVLVTGYDDATGLLEFQNSWGLGWGAQGFGYMPYAFLQQLGSDFWFISEVEGAAPPPPPPVTKTVTGVATTVLYSDGTTTRTVAYP